MIAREHKHTSTSTTKSTSRLGLLLSPNLKTRPHHLNYYTVALSLYTLFPAFASIEDQHEIQAELSKHFHHSSRRAQCCFYGEWYVCFRAQ